jgi:hypothetical protein
MAIGLPGFSPNLIQQQQRIAALPSDPEEKALAQHLIRLTQQNKVGTPEYFMAAGEFQNRQKIRQQQQATQQKPPPVVNELVAQAAQKAAPTTQGVAQLPVGGIGEIGKYTGAGGGIVAFEDGGEVQRFQNQGMVSSSPFGRDIRAFGEAGRQSMLQRTPGMLGAYGQPLFSDEERERVRLIQLIDQKYGTKGSPLLGYFTEQTPAERAQARDIISRLPTMSLPELRALAAYGPQATPVAQAIQTEGPMGGKQGTPADVRKADIAAGGIDSPAMPAQTPPYIPRSMQMGDITTSPAMSPFSALLAQAEAAVQPKGSKTLTAAERIQEQQDFLKAAGYDPEKLFKEQRESVEKEKGALAGDKRDAMNMRLVEAGLGILGGESPYAFVNIGKGASPAMKGLQEDLKDIRKLTRDYDKAIRDINLAEQSGKREMGLAALKRSQELSDKIEDRKFDLAGRMYSAEVQKYIASLPGAQERLIERFGRDPKFAEAAKGYFSTSALSRSGSSPIDDIVEKIAANPARLEQLKVLDPDLYNAVKARLAQLSIPSAITAPAGRPVRE